MEWLWNLVFPKECLLCGRDGAWVCRECIKGLRPAEERCPECSRGSKGGRVHKACRKKAVIVRLISGYSYKDRRVAKIVQEIKYNLVRQAVKDMVDNWEADVDKRWIMVPIPLHRRRENVRGFNQAEEIAKRLQAKYGLRMVKALVRVKNTRKLADIGRREKRAEEIRGAFRVVKGVEGERVVLVDDVYTSGATMKEAARELLKAGVKEVAAMTLAG